MHEMSQLDIPDRQLRTTSAHPRVSLSREIGEAQITHTIFGKAKVRIIRKHDNVRRALWWAAVMALAAVAWQGWVASQYPAPTDPASALGAKEQVNAPAAPVENIATPAPLPAEMSQPSVPPAAIDTPAASLQSAPQQPAAAAPKAAIAQPQRVMRVPPKPAARPPVETDTTSQPPAANDQPAAPASAQSK